MYCTVLVISMMSVTLYPYMHVCLPLYYWMVMHVCGICLWLKCGVVCLSLKQSFYLACPIF